METNNSSGPEEKIELGIPTKPEVPIEPVLKNETGSSIEPEKKPKSFLKIASVTIFVLIFILGGLWLLLAQPKDGVMIGDKTEEIKGYLAKKGGDAISGSLVSSCDKEYQELLACNEFDLSLCTGTELRTSQLDQAGIKTKKNNLVIIFDSSGSMAGLIDGRKKIDIAKEALNNFVGKVASDSLNLGIIVYGHKGGNSAAQKNISCAGIEDLYTMGAINKEVVGRKVASFNSTGWTPIAKSLEAASRMLAPYQGEENENFILLISDGIETCDGDPVAVMKNLKASGLRATANVVGFDVPGADSEQLKNIAKEGGGDYFSAKNTQELELVFQKHENMLNVVDFKIKSVVEQLHDISRVIMEYNECSALLKREEAAMMLDIYKSDRISPNCQAEAEKQYNLRYSEIEQRINNTFFKNKEAFNSLSTQKPQ